MSAMFGLMQMESFILTASEKDLPLYNGDFIKAAGKCTLLEEFYDTMINPLDEASVNRYREVKSRYASLPPYKTEPRWYDDIRYDFTKKTSLWTICQRIWPMRNRHRPATRRSKRLRQRLMWTGCSRTEDRRWISSESFSARIDPGRFLRRSCSPAGERSALFAGKNNVTQDLYMSEAKGPN